MQTGEFCRLPKTPRSEHHLHYSLADADLQHLGPWPSTTLTSKSILRANLPRMVRSTLRTLSIPSGAFEYS